MCHRGINKLFDKLLEVANNGQVFWAVPEHASPLLLDLHTEFSSHWLTTISTLTESVSRLSRWHMESQNDGPATLLVITRIETSVEALQAPSLERFARLIFVVSEAATKLVGSEYVKTVFELVELLEKIKFTWALGKPSFAELNVLLPALELSMEQMMLASLYAKLSVDNLIREVPLIRNAPNTFETVSINKLKAPIIQRLQTLRADAAAEGYAVSRFLPPEEGFWPPGLRGDVADVILT